MNFDDCIEVYVDNQAALVISQNPSFSWQNYAFQDQILLLCEVQKSGEVKLVYCKSED